MQRITLTRQSYTDMKEIQYMAKNVENAKIKKPEKQIATDYYFSIQHIISGIAYVLNQK
jgi:hypothetical protein